MAQAGFTPIQLYFSTTAAAVPTAGNLANGELAINITDGKLYYKSNAGVVTLLAGATAGPAGGSNTQVQFNSSGALAGSANMTFNGTTLTVNDLTDSSLTAGRVTFAGTAGNLTDSANLTWNGSTLAVTGAVNATGIIRAGSSTDGIFQASTTAGYTITGGPNYSGFYYDVPAGTAHRMRVNSTDVTTTTSTGLGVGAVPSYRLHVSSTDVTAGFFTSSAAVTSVTINNTNANAWGSNLTIATQGNPAGYFGTIGSLLGTTSQDLAVWATAGNKFRVYTNGNNLRGVFDNNGNVGFGGVEPPPNTTYPGIFLPYTTNMTSFGGAGNLLYNLYSVGAQLKWQTGGLGGSQFTFGPSSFNWNINGAGGTADANASVTNYMLLDNTGLTVTGKVAATADVTSSGAGATYPLGGLGVVGTASGSYGGIYTLGGTSCTLYFDHRGTGNTGQFTWRNGTAGATTLMNLDSSTLSSYGSNFSVGNNVASTNVNVSLNGVASKAKRIIFKTSGAESWLIGMGAASETDAFEIYNGNGNMTVSINKTTSVSSFGGSIYITPNNVAYASPSAFMVQGFAYSSDFSIANATAQIIGTRMTNNDWNPTLNIVTARQSLTAGSLSFGGIGFSTIDASNSAGMRDAARIAIVNESTSAVASPTAMAFYTNVGSATQTFPATERVRITSGGIFLVGKTGADVGTNGFRVDGSGSTYASIAAGNDTYYVYSTTAAAYRFYVSAAGTVFATNTTISAISDQRLKENIRDLDDGLDVLMALKPRKFDWKEGKGKDIKGDRGFIAQEFEAVLPEMIETWKDPAPEGEEPYKALNANLIPTLVKAIQEQQAIIESLKARLDAANL